MARQRKQQEIKGTERVTIEEVDNCAEEYRALRDKRMAFGESENKAQIALVEMMRKHNLTVYKYDDADGSERCVTVAQTAKAKVKKIKAKADDSTDDDTATSTDHNGDGVSLQ